MFQSSMVSDDEEEEQYDIDDSLSLFELSEEKIPGEAAAMALSFEI